MNSKLKNQKKLKLVQKMLDHQMYWSKLEWSIDDDIMNHVNEVVWNQVVGGLSSQVTIIATKFDRANV